MKKENKKTSIEPNVVKITSKEFFDMYAKIDKEISPKVEKRCKKIFELLKKEKITDEMLKHDIKSYIEYQEMQEAYKKNKFYGIPFESIRKAFLHEI